MLRGSESDLCSCISRSDDDRVYITYVLIVDNVHWQALREMDQEITHAPSLVIPILLFLDDWLLL